MQGHLIHIGFSKSGSTFLQEWFQQHPQLLYAPGGLGGFYNVYDISRKASQNADDNFMYFVTSDESLCTPVPSAGTIPIEHGRKDATLFQPDASAVKNACKILKGLFPNGRILFITRNFKGMILSGYSQYVRVGGVLSFRAFADHSAAALQRQIDKKTEGGGLDFSFIVNVYAEAFGKENLIVLPFEMLRDNQEKFLSLIETRLGLQHYETTISRINESLSPEALYWYPRISWIISRMSIRFGEKAYAKIYRWYVGETLKNGFHKIVRLLSRFKPGRGVSDADIPVSLQEIIMQRYWKSFIATFGSDPNYAPYLSEYVGDIKCHSDKDLNLRNILM